MCSLFWEASETLNVVVYSYHGHLKCWNNTIVQTQPCSCVYTGQSPSVSRTFNSSENHGLITTACTKRHEVWATHSSTALAWHHNSGRRDRQPSEKAATDRFIYDTTWTVVPRIWTVRDVRPSATADLSRSGQGWTEFTWATATCGKLGQPLDAWNSVATSQRALRHYWKITTKQFRGIFAIYSEKRTKPIVTLHK